MSFLDHIRRTPTAGQKAALRGTHGRPGAANRYVTETDTRITGRNPANHHSTHEPCGDDVIDHFPILTSDPVATSPLPSPACDSFWLVRNGTSPETFTLRGMVDGTIQDIDFPGTDGGSPSGSGGDLTLIQEQTPSGTGVVTFSTLGSFTHLHLLWSARSTQVAVETALRLTFNGDTGNNYDSDREFFSTSDAFAEQLGTAFAISGIAAGDTAPASLAGAGSIDVYDYRGTTFHKVVAWVSTGKTGVTTGLVGHYGGNSYWRSAAAITSLTLTLASGNFIAGSKLSLYGLT